MKKAQDYRWHNHSYMSMAICTADIHGQQCSGSHPNEFIPEKCIVNKEV
jgi:hypothetical protein